MGRERADVVGEVAAQADDQRGTMWHRAIAIDALRCCTSHPDLAVPALASALETFDEFEERGPHERVVDTLRAFGPAAGSAVPALVASMRRQDGSLDPDIVRLLGELGPTVPTARAALAALDPPERSDISPPAGTEPDPEHEPLAWALWRLGRP